MKLKEYEGKKIFKEYGIKIPKGKVIKVGDVYEKGDFIIKAQELQGERKKRGLIKDVNKDTIDEEISSLFSKCNEILVEEKVKVDKEYYISITIDRLKKRPVLIFSKRGGVDIEDVDSKDITKIVIDNGFFIDKVNDIAQKLYKIFNDYDCELVEINPLGLNKDGFVALDSKIIIDDNALFRHEEFYSKREDLNYVELDGNIGVIGNGAGLVMSTIDIIEYFNGKVANFLDLGGGADKEKMIKALEILLKKKVKGIFINIFGGITRCDEIANGLVEFKNKVPIIVRMIGTNEEEAREILRKNNIEMVDSMEEGCRKIVENVK